MTIDQAMKMARMGGYSRASDEPLDKWILIEERFWHCLADRMHLRRPHTKDEWYCWCAPYEEINADACRFNVHREFDNNWEPGEALFESYARYCRVREPDTSGTIGARPFGPLESFLEML